MDPTPPLPVSTHPGQDPQKLASQPWKELHPPLTSTFKEPVFRIRRNKCLKARHWCLKSINSGLPRAIEPNLQNLESLIPRIEYQKGIIYILQDTKS